MLENKPTGTYYKIENAQSLPAFFINVATPSDLWMFLSSHGALAAGRQNAGGSVFPYETDDRLHLSTSTGPKTLIKLNDGRIWEPFNTGYDNPYTIKRNLYKRITGDAILFEEINECLELAFSYRWETSEKYGLVRTAEIKNLNNSNAISIEVLDGVENIIPYGIAPILAQGSSCLTDAYKVCERPDNGRLAVFSLTSMIGDTVEPVEVLRANVAWYLGKADAYLLSSRQIMAFATGQVIEDEDNSVGRKGAFMVHQSLNIAPGAEESWVFVLDARLNQQEIVTLLQEVNTHPAESLRAKVEADIKCGTEELRCIVAVADGFQHTEDRNACIRHYMNVLYNNMRGGVFLNGYDFDLNLFEDFVAIRNKGLFKRRKDFFEKLKGIKNTLELHNIAYTDGDQDLIRLSMEFLPLTFSRRHGDPSRPWNYFNVRVKDDTGNPVYYYEGNWRDIFQNWEAMGLSFPGYLAPMIAKFLNASTVDGFNPYRITSEGIDWETPMPNNPWAGIGYWGDHQIVYLNKLLEWLEAYDPKSLKKLTEKEIFSYAEVPYEILPYNSLLKDGKQTIRFDFDKHNRILERTESYGEDGKLLMDGADGQNVYYVSFTEKLLVPILAKLSNLVIGGGIWMNTQRPEWNDANNAIVGNGLSMVTVYQLYRHLQCCIKLANGNSDFSLSTEVSTWLKDIHKVIQDRVTLTPRGYLDKAGAAFDRYRSKVYANGFKNGKESVTVSELMGFYEIAREALAETIDANKRDDGMYHSYNILSLSEDNLTVSPMFLMLEGQTAVLGSGRLGPEETVKLTDAMENSELLNQHMGQFFLYPIKRLNTFIERNIIPTEMAAKSALISKLLGEGHEGFVLKDAQGNIRFHDSILQSADVEKWLSQLQVAKKDADFIREIYEEVFAHKQFTGRSGIMYKYEGIGSIYWHQNSKFMLSLQEIFSKNSGSDKDGNSAQTIKESYYRLRSGFGFNKTPEQWGAFPLEPYSHSPYDMPAQQPGMTGMVKEDILTRMAELGLMSKDGVIYFDTALLQKREFLTKPDIFHYVDANGQVASLELPAQSLVYTVCQVPVVYRLVDNESVSVKVFGKGNEEKYVSNELTLDVACSKSLFSRDGSIVRIEVAL